MGSWKQYVFSLIACSLSCGIISQIISDTHKKELMHLICGTILTISILHPLSRLDLEEYFRVPILSRNAADYYISDGEKAASEAQARCIKASCEAYILNKSKMLGAEVMAQVSLNEALIPVFVEISGDADPDVQMELQKILTTDLGIPKENQKWIWNQESNSS